MAATTVNSALVEVAAAAREAAREAKAERARAMDAITDLLFERAELRALLLEAINEIWTTTPTSKRRFERRVSRVLRRGNVKA